MNFSFSVSPHFPKLLILSCSVLCLQAHGDVAATAASNVFPMSSFDIMFESLASVTLAKAVALPYCSSSSSVT